jgi:uncharacterized membrane protein
MHVARTATFEEWKLVLLSPWGTAGLVLAILAAAAAIALTVWGYRRQTRWRVRLALSALRVLSVGALLLLVLQPAIQLANVTRVPNHIAILLDLSRSMAIREREGEASRLERALAALNASRSRLERWRRERSVDLWGFGSTLRALQRTDGIAPVDHSTQIQLALAELRRQHRGRDLAGVIILSDGVDNGQLGTGPLAPASRRFLARLEAPIHTLWVGRERIRDLALVEVFADAFAFVRNAVKVEAEVIASGLGDVSVVPIRLETGGATVALRELHLQPGVERYRVQFEFVPPRVGNYVYTISAPVYAGEALAHNNSRSFLLRVIRDRIRVLQVCGRPSWDERFLRQLLKRDPNVDLISFFILRTPADLALVPPTELSLIPFPTEELFERELGSFDLVILQNFNYRPYGIGIYLPHLKRYVEAGGGLAMIGGDLSFSSGEYAGTPVAEVLPVRLFPDPGDRARLISEEEFKLRPTPDGGDHPILQLGQSRADTQQILGGLAPLAGVNLVAGAAPGATVLAAHPTLRDGDGRPMPVLAAAEPAKGRTLALTTDSSWHWAFPAVGAGGTRQAYDRFWRNAIRWLIQDPELRYLRVIAQQDVIRLGAPLRATIRAYNPDYSPARELKVAYEVAPVGGGGAAGIPVLAPKRALREDGIAREVVTGAEGEAQIEHALGAVGAYRIHARADIGGRRTEEEALVLVELAGHEEREPRATPALLRQLSAATGGHYLGGAGALPELPFRQPRVLHVNWRKDIELWSRWWYLVACIGFLGLEWLVRRRYGYL